MRSEEAVAHERTSWQMIGPQKFVSLRNFLEDMIVICAMSMPFREDGGDKIKMTPFWAQQLFGGTIQIGGQGGGGVGTATLEIRTQGGDDSPGSIISVNVTVTK